MLSQRTRRTISGPISGLPVHDQSAVTRAAVIKGTNLDYVREGRLTIPVPGPVASVGVDVSIGELLRAADRKARARAAV